MSSHIHLDSVVLERGLRLCICHLVPSDANAASVGVHTLNSMGQDFHENLLALTLVS